MLDSLTGIYPREWYRLLKKHGRLIHRNNWFKLVFITINSLINVRLKKRENKHFADKIVQTKIVQDPVFILGHWRSGTTLLHNLISQDTQFAYPNLMQVKNPYTFLIREESVRRFAKKAGRVKRSMDNMEITWESPSEEEFGLAVVNLKSPLIGWIFPSMREYYDHYLTFENVPSEEIEVWKQDLLYFIKKLTLRYEKPILLKSPTNTGRISILKQLFPNAKFIHIHRNPYDVFNSTSKLQNTAVLNSSFERNNGNDDTEYILKRYNDLYANFERDTADLAENNFIDIAFEDLAQNPLTILRTVYEKLEINDFDLAQPQVQAYLDANRSYKKNAFKPMPEELVRRINDAWSDAFDRWAYEKK